MNESTIDNRRVLDVQGLRVEFGQGEDAFVAVRDLSLHVDRGETLAIVGESGSGKSVTSLACMRLVESGGGQIASGRILMRRKDGRMTDLVQAPEADMRRMRGSDMAMIFQEPMTSLNPVLTVGSQLAEAITLHRPVSQRAALAEAARILDQVRIPGAQAILRRYPHELSGGMRQRVMIAMALSCRPSLLIADEPTTALDVTVQAQILQLIKALQREMDMGVVFITHDMGVVAEVADRVVVMRHGQVVEHNETVALFERPSHPYTRALLAAVPRLGAMQGTALPARFPLLDESGSQAETAEARTPAYGTTPLMQVEGIVTRFDVREGILARVTKRVHAVEQVSFDLYPGETLSLVGESGCGKTTTGRTLLGLTRSLSGRIRFEGRDVASFGESERRALRRHIQFVFQDPFASLNPRMRIGDSIMEPMLIHGIATGQAARSRTGELLERVGLSAAMMRRFPHEFSGGQRQRICIARALAAGPKVVVADESVSALDVSIQAQIVNLLIDLQQEFGMAYLFISHDMAVVERISHRIAVMYLGQIVEIGPRQAVFENPQHPYTRKLMAAVPIADPTRRQARELMVSEIPSPVRAVGDEPEVMPLIEVAAGHYVARHSVGGTF